MLPTKLALRLARRWQDAWEANHHPASATDVAWDRIETRFERARRIVRHLDIARAGVFPSGVRRLASDLGFHLGELARSANRLRDDLIVTRPLRPGLSSWLAEVRQLEDEFGAVEVRWADKVARAVTEPITLRGVELGRFALDFHWDRLASARGVDAFEVVALDPNPAAGRDDVTHPHVRDNDLCAGDAVGPVQRALDEGRFADAFLLIRGVLTTYNRESPYVALDKWSGSPCHECGVRVEDEDRYSCEGCDNDLCERCTCSCGACGSTRCNACLSECALCDSYCCSGCLERRGDESICKRCIATCVLCGGRVPKNELIDQYCTDCTQDAEDDDDDDDNEPAPIQAGVEVE